ncbi:ABC transporter permease [Mesorhizobium sp. CCNWLW179-1]|uniref:ABC transporter permease n=1 Tax=unclassified Mesorhizobium TaxID=325217 RepID=UPI0030146799
MRDSGSVLAHPNATAGLIKNLAFAGKAVETHSAQRILLSAPILALIVPVLLLLSWEVGVGAGIVNPRFFPAPSSTIAKAYQMLVDGSLFGHVYGTLYRVFLGYVPGAIVGIVVGLLIGTYGLANAMLRPTLTAFYTVPKLGIFPLLLLLSMSSIDAARNVPPGYVDVARVFKAPTFSRFFEITLPSSAAMIFSGLRLAMGQAILVIIAAEMVNGTDGIGYLIWHSWSIFSPASMFVGIIVSALLGFFLINAINVIERLALPWAHHAAHKPLY